MHSRKRGTWRLGPCLLAAGMWLSARGAEILALLTRIHEERGTTIVMVTHDEAAAGTCRRVVKIRDGRVESDR